MSDYDPVKCLQEEVDRFKSTNQFTPMLVTGFYFQAAVVLDEHKRQKERIAELEAQLADAKLPPVEWIQDIYELTKLKGEVEQLKRENAQLKASRDHAIDELLRDQLPESKENWEKVWASHVETTKERDQLRKENVELKKAVADYVQLCGDLANDREKLHLQVVRLRESLIIIDGGQRAKTILSETPAQSAKEVLGPTVELLMELKPFIVSWSRDTLIEKLLKEIARLKRLFE